MEMKVIGHCEFDLDKVVSGWLSPAGMFYECHWGNHTETAYDIVNENDWFDDYREKRRAHETRYVRDYLVTERNFILLDNPYYNKKTQIIQYCPFKEHPKRQINKLLRLFAYSEKATVEVIYTFCKEE